MNMDIPTILDYWKDEEVMKNYYEAICDFRRVFDKVYNRIHEDKKEYCGNGFKGWPDPNQCFYVSMKGIFLPITLYDGVIKVIGSIRSPFGEIKVIGSGWGSTINKVAQQTFEAIHEICDLIDVSDTVRLHNLNLYGEEKNQRVYGDGEFNKKDKYHDKIEYKLYLLHFKDERYNQVVNINNSDLHIFVNVNNSDTVYNSKKKLFKKLSNGTNCFNV